MATLPETKTLALDLEQGWLTVWFNQPERRNPLTDEAVNQEFQNSNNFFIETRYLLAFSISYPNLLMLFSIL